MLPSEFLLEQLNCRMVFTQCSITPFLVIPAQAGIFY
jgi:hypothetical protein